MIRKLRTERDNQQWMLDLALNMRGRVQNFERDDIEVPAGKRARNYRMLPKVWREAAERNELLARRAEAQGLLTHERFRELAIGCFVRFKVRFADRYHADVVKALAMGATAVGVGKPYLWGLGAFGQDGVESVLKMLQAETIASMAQVGASRVKDLNPKLVHRA